MSDSDGLRRRSSAPKQPATNSTTSKTKKDEATSSPVVRIIKLLIALAVVAEISCIAYMMTKLVVAGTGGHGETTAVADDIKTLLPLHFKGLQRTMAFTGGFYTNSHATEYFESQKPFFKASAAKLKLHRYFTTLQLPNEITWNNMIHERIKAFAKLLQEEGRDDYKVEKDRCAMYNFFSKNNLPICKVLGQWQSQDKIIDALQSGEVKQLAGGDFPIFLKACHLTQSSSRGTYIISSEEKLDEKVKDKTLESWINQKWNFRANDFERVWVNEGNMLTNAVKPAILVQGPFKQPGHDWDVHGRFAVGLLEFRIEVLWGRAYFALLDGCILFFRDGVVEDYSTALGFLKIPVFDTPKLKWITDGGYMDCIWDLAERTARATATESVRLDIFLKRGDPKGCTINENSLSSGMLYWGHESYIAQTWASGHISKGYQKLETDKPVYELGPEDTGG